MDKKAIIILILYIIFILSAVCYGQSNETYVEQEKYCGDIGIIGNDDTDTSFGSFKDKILVVHLWSWG
ncbi:hypothetical protein ACFL6G_09785 [candidate division KSB1 bacterium]